MDMESELVDLTLLLLLSHSSNVDSIYLFSLSLKNKSDRYVPLDFMWLMFRYEVPTPVQMQTLPVALSGRDVVGIAKTGSGKTASYVLPLCIHVISAPTLKRGEGPIAVVLSPTRELSEQIHKQTRIFAKPYGIKIQNQRTLKLRFLELTVAACFGGLSKYEQVKALRSGSDVVVATPGRLIDLIKVNSYHLFIMFTFLRPKHVR